MNNLYFPARFKLLIALTLTLAAFSPNQASEFNIHPAFELLDKAGQNVLDSSQPASPARTCAVCHDVDFISKHSQHSLTGKVFGDGSVNGSFYAGWEYTDNADQLTAWLKNYGSRHVGGGIFAELGLEHDCFLCHLENADADSRSLAIENSDFAMAASATLSASPLLSIKNGKIIYNRTAFDKNGMWPINDIPLGEPGNQNCAACHGIVHENSDAFFIENNQNWKNRATGIIWSPQRISSSALNLADKDNLNRSWDVHAERLLNCTSCHNSLNNPVYKRESSLTRPEHLIFDGRRISLGDYVRRPVHEFTGSTSTYDDSPEVDSIRQMDCVLCHNADKAHDWLPYKSRHFEKLACEACHLPQVHFSSLLQEDWTALDEDGQPLRTWRGNNSQPFDPQSFIEKYTPLQLQDSRRNNKLAPFAISTIWRWEDENGTPVDYELLRSVWQNIETETALGLFDQNANGKIEIRERRLRESAQTDFILAKLNDLGSTNYSIKGRINHYPLNHGIVSGKHALRKCESCHSRDSRLKSAVAISSWIPSGGLLIEDDLPIYVFASENGGHLIASAPTSIQETHNYVLGADHLGLVDLIGIFSVIAVLILAAIHGLLRFKGKKQNEVSK
jgi:hypothetical protein